MRHANYKDISRVLAWLTRLHECLVSSRLRIFYATSNILSTIKADGIIFLRFTQMPMYDSISVVRLPGGGIYNVLASPSLGILGPESADPIRKSTTRICNGVSAKSAVDRYVAALAAIPR